MAAPNPIVDSLFGPNWRRWVTLAELSVGPVMLAARSTTLGGVGGLPDVGQRIGPGDDLREQAVENGRLVRPGLEFGEVHETEGVGAIDAAALMSILPPVVAT